MKQIILAGQTVCASTCTLGCMLVALTAATLFSGCSLDVPRLDHSLKITLQDNDTVGNLFHELLPNSFGILSSNPSTTSDFNCFAVNVTGQGISSYSKALSGCTTSSNMHGRGAGVISRPSPRGTSIEVDVPAGTGRTIDVYGIYPPASECGGSSNNSGGGGFLMGSLTRDLADSTSVTIGVSYNGAAADPVCTGGDTTTPSTPITSAGLFDPSFNDTGTGVNSAVLAIVSELNTTNPTYGTGRFLIGGSFAAYNGTGVPIGLIMVDQNGDWVSAFNNGGAGLNGGAQVTDAILMYSGGNPVGDFLIGGTFTTYNGTSAAKIARIESDGTLSGSFSSGTGFDNDVKVLRQRKDTGDTFVGGAFTTYNSTTVNKFAKISSNGTLDGIFNANQNAGSGLNNTVYAILPEKSAATTYTGNILVGGMFTTMNGTSFGRIVRLASSGSADATFNNSGTGFDNTVQTLNYDCDLKLLVGGDFTTYNGSDVPDRIVRLNVDGSIDSTFNSGGAGLSAGSVRQIQPEMKSDGSCSGKYLIAGIVSGTYNGTTIPGGVFRINGDGSLDTSFNTGGAGFSSGATIDQAKATNSMFSGTLLTGGSWTTYNGSSVPRGLIRLR